MAIDESNWEVNLEQRKKIIRQQPVFAALSLEETEILASLLKEKKVIVGEIIVQESDPIDSVYFIVSGSANVQHITYKNGEQQTTFVAVLRAGDTIGLNDSGFYSVTGRRTATVRANESMLLLRLGLAVFHGFALVHPHVNRVMREHAAKMLNMR